MLKQYEEADALFQISAFNVLEAARNLLAADIAARPQDVNAARAMDWVESNLAEIAAVDIRSGQQRMLEAVQELAEDFPDLHMRVSNTLYVRSLRDVRALEAKAATLDPAANGAAIDGIRARVRTLAADIVFYANEAYLSEGPFLHIVKAIQTVLTKAGTLPVEQRDAYIKSQTASELAKLSTGQLLQSFNEQLGDLFKDFLHYGEDRWPGLGFYRSSKYLDRLLDAALLLKRKVPDLDISIPGATLSTEALKVRVAAGLLEARKGRLVFGDNGAVLSGDALKREIEAFAMDEVEAMFGVTTLADMRTICLTLGETINVTLRSGELGVRLVPAEDADLPYFS
jgi:hypothetical protein